MLSLEFVLDIVVTALLVKKVHLAVHDSEEVLTLGFVHDLSDFYSHLCVMIVIYFLVYHFSVAAFDGEALAAVGMLALKVEAHDSRQSGCSSLNVFINLLNLVGLLSRNMNVTTQVKLLVSPDNSVKEKL